MGIFIKNPQTEKAVRDVAAMRGASITATIDALAREALERGNEESGPSEPVAFASQEPAQGPQSRPRPRKRSLEEMRAATREFRRKTGLDRQESRPMGKSVWDALWPTGMREIDNA